MIELPAAAPSVATSASRSRVLATGLLALLAFAARGADDPRFELVDLQLVSDPESRLRVVEEAQRRPMGATDGLEYLRGRLLVEIDRHQEAQQAFLRAIGSSPQLTAYSRYQLASAHAALGRSETAASLVATVLSSGPPRPLIAPSLALLAESLAREGDCRVLRGIEGGRLGDAGRRRLQLIRALCAAKADDPKTDATDPGSGTSRSVEAWLFALLEDNRRDDVARQAAELLTGPRFARERDAREHMLLGMALHNHRQFGVAIQNLSRAIARAPDANDISRSEVFDMRYALARSHFWEGRFHVAAASFASLARDAHLPSQRTRTLYQQGRSLELDGQIGPAITVFEQAYRAEPSGDFASSALLSQLRLHWRDGREDEAMSIYRRLEQRRRPGDQRKALLFFASSDLVQGRADRASSWLTTAARGSSRDQLPEVAYWQGRLAEATGDREMAVERYATVLTTDAYDPFATEARRRLRQDTLRAVANKRGYTLARSNRLDELYTAWLLLGDDEVGRAARSTLRSRFESDVATAPFLDLAVTPPDRWPLFEGALREPEERLLALGLWQEGASVVMRHFPLSDPRLAYTGSLMLARAGETRRSLYIAEILRRRVPNRLPSQLISQTFRRLLYPFRYGYLILRESQEQSIDPYLLAAIIREESRFDAGALSAAAARGLAQFVLPTARRLAPAIGRDTVAPEDLNQPEVSIALGAAYLHELADRFDGTVPQMVAAYNAGEAQSEAWRRYCFSDDPAEFYTKVTFRETRGYLDKVLTSYAHYVELYGEDGL